MPLETTLGATVVASGVGLHTNRRARVTLRPAPGGSGLRVAAGPDDEAVPLRWDRRVPSTMSTSVALPGGGAVRTVEHLMAALAACGVDNVRAEVEGPEVPIFDGSAAPWCRLLERAGLQRLATPRRPVRVLKPVQIERHGGFLRVEPADTFEIDVTYSLVPDFPVMGWSGPVERERFTRDLARARSFGSLGWRRRRSPAHAPRPPFPGEAVVVPHRPDPTLPNAAEPALARAVDEGLAARDPAEPVLRGARPWTATLVVGRRVLPWGRFRDEPMRHVVLDMIGDLALAGAPLRGRVVSHNPSHEKTYMLVAALMADLSAWTLAPETAEACP